MKNCKHCNGEMHENERGNYCSKKCRKAIKQLNKIKKNAKRSNIWYGFARKE